MSPRAPPLAIALAIALLSVAAAAPAAAAPAAQRVCPPFAEPDGEGGCVVCDCAGVCRDAARVSAWPADGHCDATAPDYACAAFEHDGGDCAPSFAPDDADVVLRDNIFESGITALLVTA